MNLEQKITRAKSMIRYAIAKYREPIISCSFGKDSMVLLHLARQIKPDIKVFSVLSDSEFEKTYQFRDEMVKNWNLNYQEYNVVNDPDNLADCCRSKKVAKFKEALQSYDCWLSGIRQDEGETRADFGEIEERDGLIKVNPILYFTETDIWRYCAVYQVPPNPMYQEGYRSLSCSRCSAKELDTRESERAGRWKGTVNQGKECGIHTQSLRR